MNKELMSSAAAFLTASVLLVGAANADQLGEREYLTYCASCHGTSGIGDGAMAEFMSTNNHLVAI